jgi:hypothetical protein
MRGNRFRLVVVLLLGSITVACSSAPPPAIELTFLPDPITSNQPNSLGIAQLYPGPVRDATSVCVISAYAGSPSRKSAWVTSVQELSTKRMWKMDAGQPKAVFETLPGRYLVEIRRTGAAAGKWIREVDATAGAAYAFAAAGSGPPELLRKEGTDVATVRATIGHTRDYALPYEPNPAVSRFVLVRTDTPLVRTLTRNISFVTWQRFIVEHSTRKAIESLVGKPSRETSDGPVQVCEYEQIVYVTEREQGKPTSAARALTLGFDAGGSLVRIIH